MIATHTITPRTLKGFRDHLPPQQTIRETCIHAICRLLRNRGFLPIDTPILEYTEILLGKGGGETDKQIYRFDDHGKRDIALRYDLTVPLARFVATHVPKHTIPLPCMLYHIGNVFRGENSQRGRYREFTQCDFDIIGADSLGADCTILLTAAHVLQHMLPMLNTTLEKKGAILFSHRTLLTSLFDALDIRESRVEVLKIIDKADKIGRDRTLTLLDQLVNPTQRETLLHCISLKGSPSEVCKELAKTCPIDDSLLTRLKDMYDIVQHYLSTNNYPLSCQLDMHITRGLDYYTGLVFECFISDTSLGSVCSGGRYNNLAGLFGKTTLSGVGGSLGLDRILECVDTSAFYHTDETLHCVIACKSEQEQGRAYALLAELSARQVAHPIHLYPCIDNNKQLSRYLKYVGANVLITFSEHDYLIKYIGSNTKHAQTIGLPIQKTPMTDTQLYHLLQAKTDNAPSPAIH